MSSVRRVSNSVPLRETHSGKSSFSREEERRIWFKFCEERDANPGRSIDYNKIATELKIPGRNADQIKARIKNIRCCNKNLAEKFDQEFQVAKPATSASGSQFGSKIGCDGFAKKIAEWLCNHNAVQENISERLTIEICEQVVRDIGKELDVHHYQELTIHLFDYEILIQRFCKEIKETREASVSQAMEPNTSTPVSNLEAHTDNADGGNEDDLEVITVSSDSEDDWSEPARRATVQVGTPDPTNDGLFDLHSAVLEEGINPGQHENMHTEERTPRTNQDGLATLDMPQLPIAELGFANAYYSRVNLYDYQRVGAVPPKLSRSERYQRCIPDRLYKQDEFRSIFDFIELRQVGWKNLLEPNTVKFVFDTEDEFILKERIYYHGKTAEQLQLDLFKFGLPRRAEYIFKYFEKPLAVPLKFEKMERLLAVLMFHSLLKYEDDSDWSRVLKNLFIDGIVVGGDLSSWLWEFHLQVFCKDADYFASSPQQLTEMKRKMKLHLMKNI